MPTNLFTCEFFDFIVLSASSAKAGLSRNQDDINRQIYEASKGSKYFENEKRSDERTTEQIAKLLKKRDELLDSTPPGSEAWNKLERKIDERAMQLEASRDFSRIILHADMDMFYAAVELKRDPSLLGKAFGVGSGVLVTASYEARQFGVRSGMASHIALALCPHLIIVKNDMASYVAASKDVMSILENYDSTYAQMSLDEAYLDVTTYCEMNKMNVEEVVQQLQGEIKMTTGLTASVGIAPNKMLAKISSDRNKPNGYFHVLPERLFIINLMQEMPCRKVPGIGRFTERILSSLGVEKCGDIWISRVMLSLVLGDIDGLLNSYLGIHSNVVEPAKRGERRSVGREHTFRPTNDVSALKEFLRQSAAQVAKDLERLDYRGKTITLTFKTDAFRRYTRAKTMQYYQYKEEEIFATACKLLDAEHVTRGGPMTLRLIGVRLSGLKDLRGPEKGGLKQLFENPSKSPQKPSRDEQAEREASNPDEQELQQAIQKSMEEEKEEFIQEMHQRSLVECPICQNPIECRGTFDKCSATINNHIDRCLSNETQQAEALPKGKRKAGGPLDSFVQRKVKQA